MFTGQDVMLRAGIVLNDEDHVRWRPSELCEWINEALSAIVLAKPSARSETRLLTLAEGTHQTIAAVSGAPVPLALISINRNIKSSDQPRIGGRTIRATSGPILDAQEPNWHDPDRVRFAKEVRQYVYDEQNLLEFYVYPGNDGHGLVEAVVGVMPAALVATGDAESASSYAATIDLQPVYQAPVLDYVLYRAYSKDDPGNQPGSSQTHYRAFATAIGIKIQVEGGSSPNARRAVT